MLGLGAGLSSVDHKSFEPSDISDIGLWFDFTSTIPDYGVQHYTTSKFTGVANDTVAAGDTITQIRLKSGGYVSTTNTGQSGVAMIGTEMFYYGSVSTSGSDTTTLGTVTRASYGSSAADWDADDVVQFICTHPDASFPLAALEPRIYDRVGGSIYLDPSTNGGDFPRRINSGLGQTSKPALIFDGTNDRLPFSSTFTTTNGEFTVVNIVRLDGTVSGDATLAGSSGGINQIKYNANTVLVRFNSSGSAHGYAQVQLNDTTSYTTGSRGTPVDKGGSGSSYIVDENELMILVKELGTDNKEKIYVYDAVNLVGEHLKNSSNSTVQGYPNDDTSPANTGFEIAHMGAFANNASDFQGEIAELIIYNKALSNAECELLQEYYSTKYASLRSD